jgi:hypothetical protein
VSIPVIKGSLRPGQDLDGRAYVRMSDLSETKPRPEGESAALISDRDGMNHLLGERKGPQLGRWFGQG